MKSQKGTIVVGIIFICGLLYLGFPRPYLWQIQERMENWLLPTPAYGTAYDNRHTSAKENCIRNLRLLDQMKWQWAQEHNKPTTAVPTEADLLPYTLHWGNFREGKSPQLPTCPTGGKYSINALAGAPTCSITNHVLP